MNGTVVLNESLEQHLALSGSYRYKIQEYLAGISNRFNRSKMIEALMTELDISSYTWDAKRFSKVNDTATRVKFTQDQMEVIVKHINKLRDPYQQVTIKDMYHPLVKVGD